MQDAVANLLHQVPLLHHLEAGVEVRLLDALLLLFLKSSLHKTHQKLACQTWLGGVPFETFVDKIAEKVEILLLEAKVDAQPALLPVESCRSRSTELHKHFSKEHVAFLKLRMLPLNVVDLR